jgi:hypothetical protein
MNKAVTIFYTLLTLGVALYWYITGTDIDRDSIQFALILLCYLYLRHPEFMRWLKHED